MLHETVQERHEKTGERPEDGLRTGAHDVRGEAEVAQLAKPGEEQRRRRKGSACGLQLYNGWLERRHSDFSWRCA